MIPTPTTEEPPTVIRFRAMKGTPYLVHNAAFCQCSLTVTEEEAPGLYIVGVFLNGRPMRFQAINALSVSVRPWIPLECGTVDVYLQSLTKAPRNPAKATDWPAPHHPKPCTSYGLQPPQADYRKKTP